MKITIELDQSDIDALRKAKSAWEGQAVDAPIARMRWQSCAEIVALGMLTKAELAGLLEPSAANHPTFTPD